MRIVCVNNKDYTIMLNEWQKQFEKQEATAIELEEASLWFVKEWLPLHITAQWGSHPGTLRQRIFEERNRIKRKTANQEYMKAKEPLSFKAEGQRSNVLNAMRGIGKPRETKQ